MIYLLITENEQLLFKENSIITNNLNYFEKSEQINRNQHTPATLGRREIILDLLVLPPGHLSPRSTDCRSTTSVPSVEGAPGGKKNQCTSPPHPSVVQDGGLLAQIPPTIRKKKDGRCNGQARRRLLLILLFNSIQFKSI